MHSNICIQIVTIELSVCSLDSDFRIATKWLVFLVATKFKLFNDSLGKKTRNLQDTCIY